MSRVMIVDDEEAILKALQRVLRLAPCICGNKTFPLEVHAFTRRKPHWMQPVGTAMTCSSATTGCRSWTASNFSRPPRPCSRMPRA